MSSAPWRGTLPRSGVGDPFSLTPAMIERTASTATEPRTVLLVQDDDDDRAVYATMLRHVGYAVLEAVDGEEALAGARRVRPSLVLMDISVPGVDGLEATHQRKRAPAIAPIPVIALTAHAVPADRQRCIDAGCDGYPSKPCEPHTVAQAVDPYLRLTCGRAALAPAARRGRGGPERAPGDRPRVPTPRQRTLAASVVLGRARQTFARSPS